MSDISRYDFFHWAFCGDETWASLLGCWDTAALAEESIKDSHCGHDHTVFVASIDQIVQKLRSWPKAWSGYCQPLGNKAAVTLTDYLVGRECETVPMRGTNLYEYTSMAVVLGGEVDSADTLSA